MRVALAPILAGIAAVGKCMDLHQGWSFASTTTITDGGTPWYTISVPFLTTITTHVSGTVETITATKVAISIGTEAPSTVLPTTLVSSLVAIPCTTSIILDDAAGPDLVHDSAGVEARALLTSSQELITHTHFHLQSNTIDDSDIVPTVLSTSHYWNPAASSLTPNVTGTTAPSSTASVTTRVSATGYGGGDEATSTTTSVHGAMTVTVTVTVHETTIDTADSGLSTVTSITSMHSSPGYITATASVTNSTATTQIVTETSHSTTSTVLLTYGLSSSAIGPVAISSQNENTTTSTVTERTISASSSFSWTTMTKNHTVGTTIGSTTTSTCDETFANSTILITSSIRNSTGIATGTYSTTTSYPPTTTSSSSSSSSSSEEATPRVTTVRTTSTLTTTASPDSPYGSPIITTAVDATTGAPAPSKSKSSSCEDDEQPDVVTAPFPTPAHTRSTVKHTNSPTTGTGYAGPHPSLPTEGLSTLRRVKREEGGAAARWG
ncbi:hypothetical protein F5B17DRAFT_450035 [Nemania serpens]|nr:hypothetical protein F5B17DRAFT_450035 [Nemania serpens]